MTMDPAKLRDRLRGVVKPLGTAGHAAPVTPSRVDESGSDAPAPAPASAPASAAAALVAEGTEAVSRVADGSGGDASEPLGATPETFAASSDEHPQMSALVPAASSGGAVISGAAVRTLTGRPARRASNVESVLGGEWRSDGRAKSFVVTRRVEADATYGKVRVGDLATQLTAAQGGATLLATGVPQTPFIFFDLETTGLSGGAGTHAFLIGVSWFEADGSFVIEQHVMTDYAAERGMLTVAAGDLSRAGALVTFNGKSFDAPVLETRYLFHRMTSPYAQVPHVDLLHPARRFWGGHAELGCSLIALEQQLLGTRRVGDVPGFEIPERYFQFVRGGDAQPLADVLEHNRLDLLSLAGLTARLLHIVTNGPQSTDDARECLALGRVYDRANDHVRAVEAYERAAALATPGQSRPVSRRMSVDWTWTPQGIRAEAYRSLAMGARRERRFNDAAGWWRQLLEVPGCPAQLRRDATEALAIHHEHRVRDLAAAKMFALKSLEAGEEAAWGDAVRHRLARIERKMTSERPLFPSSP